MLGYAESEDEYSQLIADILEFALKNITAQNLEYIDEDVFRLLGFLKMTKKRKSFILANLRRFVLMRDTKRARRDTPSCCLVAQAMGSMTDIIT